MGMMDTNFLVQFIKELDHQSNDRRFELLQRLLINQEIPTRVQTYATGKNMIIDVGEGEQYYGVSSHFDKVPFSGGANDNASALAVCLSVISKHRTENSNIPLRIFFFDEEETGLKGSTAYVQKFGVSDIHCLINLEMVGIGDRFALWPLGDVSGQNPIADHFENVAQQLGVPTSRYDEIVTSTADHLSFANAGFQNVFTLTCITEIDQQVGYEYKCALTQHQSMQALAAILDKAPLFRHYHMPSDTFETISEETIEMTASTIWKVIKQMQQETDFNGE
jgi:hypothetical protein